MTSRDQARWELLRLIREHPGMHLRELERASASSLGSIRHHLGKLQRQGIVRVEFDRRFKRYYPLDLTAASRRAAMAARQRPLRRILRELLARPRAGPAALHAALGIPLPSLSTYLRRLRNLGLVQADAARKGYEVTDPDAVAAALRSVQERGADRLITGALDLFEALDSRPPSRREGGKDD